MGLFRYVLTLLFLVLAASTGYPEDARPAAPEAKGKDDMTVKGAVFAEGFVGPRISVGDAYIEGVVDADEGLFTTLSASGLFTANEGRLRLLTVSERLEAANGDFDSVVVRKSLTAGTVTVSGDLEVTGSFGITRDTVIEVDVNGGHDFRTLQAAIDFIGDSGPNSPTAFRPYIIKVYPGVYELEEALGLEVPYTLIQGVHRESVILQPAESISRLSQSQPPALVLVDGAASHSGLVNLTLDVDPDAEGARYEWAGSIVKFTGSDSVKNRFDGFLVENCTFLGPHDWNDKRDEGSMTIGGKEIDTTYNVNPLLSAYTDNPVLLDVIEFRNCTFQARSDADILRMEGSVGAVIKDSYFHGYASSNINKYHGYRGTMIRINPMARSECRLTMYRSLLTSHGRGRALLFQSGNVDKASAVIYSTDLYGFAETFGREKDVTANLLLYGTE